MPSPQVKPDTMDYAELMSEIDSGVLKIPEFQREFEWDIERTLRLLDSIAKGYPVGAFLVWNTDETFGSVRNIGDIELPQVPEGKEVSYVLDGQQRITSLYAAAKRAMIDGESYRVYCDLDADPAKEELFVRSCPDETRHVDLAEIIGDSPQLVTPRITEQRQRRFNEIREAFLRYRFPVVRVRNQPLDAVCKMFERVNTGGMELDVFDIMVAKTWKPDFNLRDKWEEFREELEPLGFGSLGARVMLQALAADVKGGVAESDIMEIRREEIEPAWGRATDAIRLAIDFLRQNVRLPGTRFLPYASSVVILSRFFGLSNCRAPDKTQARRLVTYFWRTGFTERYGSNPSSTMIADLKLMTAIAEGTEGELEVDWPVTPDDVLSQPLRTGSAYCRALLALLGHEKPVDIRNGGGLILDNSYLARANSRHYHHIFPKKWLATEGIEENVNSVANVMLVPAQANLRIGAKPPSKYMTSFVKKAKPDWRKWLLTHRVNKRAAEFMISDDFNRFVRQRSRLIADRANKLMGLSPQEVRRLIAQWDESEDS